MSSTVTFTDKYTHISSLTSYLRCFTYLVITLATSEHAHTTFKPFHYIQKIIINKNKMKVSIM